MKPPGGAVRRPRPPLRRRLLFLLLAAVLVLLAVELVAQIGFRFAHGFGYRPERLARLSRAVSYLPVRLQEELGDQIVHPFLGVVREIPDRRGEFHGFVAGDNSSPFARAPGDVLVLLCGGSVATDVGIGAPLAASFERCLLAKGIADRRVRVFTAALGGLKQPQQLMTLNWFLVLGARFDVVVNLDGFNDMVLSVFENARRGVYPAFPRGWQAQLQKLGAGADVGELIWLRREQQRLLDDARRLLVALELRVGPSPAAVGLGPGSLRSPRARPTPTPTATGLRGL